MSDYIEALGIIAPKAVYKNLTPAQLVEHALPFVSANVVASIL